jgi:hypothetical protein
MENKYNDEQLTGKKQRLQVMLEPWSIEIANKISKTEDRAISDVLRILIEIGIFTLLDNPAEVKKRIKRIDAVDPKMNL